MDMPNNFAAIFLFLAAAVVAVFAFLSIVVWVSRQSQDRQTRDRLALLKTIAENPSENAGRVLEMLREHEEKRMQRERTGWIAGGLIVMAVGVGLCTMLAMLAGRGEWSVGLIPLLIGCVLFGVGLFSNRRTRKDFR
jgi:Flp pilus assembly protein TadB